MEENIKKQHENPEGLHARYEVKKLVKYKPKYGRLRYVAVPTDPNAEYFVLRLDNGGSDPNHIRAGRIAIDAYAREIESHIPQLAKDLRERYPVVSEEPGDALANAASIVVNALRNNEGYYYAWHANLAMSFQHEFNKEYSEQTADIWQISDISNKAATLFLNTLIEVTK